MPLGVKGKVLEIDSLKILRPDPGLYSQYFPSYDIFRELQIFRHAIFNLFLFFFWLSFLTLLKSVFNSCYALGVKEKVLEIDSQKILRPDPGLYSQYFPSYAISCDSQICFHFLFGAKPG